jgi:phosphoribosylformimino-5-aminoimidazole carboxamide ribonucleotide (ProFAR) isomerase
MMFKFVDSLQIRASGGVESIQDIKAVQVVVAPLPIGHRNIAGGVPERRCVQVTACGSSTGREEDDGEY